MTVSSTTVKSGPYNGNGSATNFAVNTVYTAKSEVTVIVTSAAGVETTKTLDTHYTLTAPGDSGTVTFLVAPASGETVTILTTLAQTQATDLTPGGSFSANVVEGALDKLTRLVQQIAEKVTRAPKLRQTSATGEVSLPEPSALAFLRWNAAGTGFENGTTGGPGSGDVVGPSSSTNNNLVAFDGTGGNLLKDSGISISNVLTEAEAALTYQPLDADLTAIAALSTTAFGRSVLTQASAAALATLAGLGTGDSPQFAGLLLPTGAAISWNAGDVTATHSANTLAFAGATSGYSFDNALNISPPAASTTKAINASQTGPTSGTHGTSFDFNTIAIGSEQISVSGTVYGLAVTHGFGGSNALGQRTAIRGLLVMNTATSASQPLGNAYSAVSGEGQMSAGDNGTDTASGAKGTMIGLYGSSIAAAGATNLHRMAGAEINTAIRATASARYHVGMQITQWGDHAVSGAELDAGLQFGNQSGAVGWDDYGIVFDVSSAGLGTLFTANATILGTKGAVTAARGINFESATFTGAAFASNGFFVNGSGDIFGPSLTGGLNASSNLVIKSTGGAGTTDFIAFRVGNNGAVEAGRVLTDGKIIAGHTAAIGASGEGGGALFSPRVQIHGIDAATASLSVTRWSASASQGRVALAKSRGATAGTRGVVVDGDALGHIVFNGDDGTNFIIGAAIGAVVFGTPGTNDMPTALEFWTTADGAAAATRHLRITPTGQVIGITPTGGLGYGIGAGGAITQATSRTTGVTLNTICGEITLVSAAGSATYQSFTVTNSAMAATDTVEVNQKSGTDLYEIHVTAKAAGSFRITFRTTGGTTTEQPVFGFSITRAVAS